MSKSSHVSVLEKITPRYWHFPSAEVLSTASGGVVVYDWLDRTEVSFANAEVVETVAKSMTMLDWSDGAVLASALWYVIPTVDFPTSGDWARMAERIPERPGTSAVVLYDSCETYDTADESASGMDPIPYRGYAYYVPDQLHWTELDNTSLHKDILEGNGENGLPAGWKVYTGPDKLVEASRAYVEALMSSPYFYYMLDTGSCQKPTKERVYRLFVDPNDPTRAAIDYWGNLGSTNDTIYRRFILKDYFGSGRSAIVTVENGRLVARAEPTEVFDFAKYEVVNAPFPTFGEVASAIDVAVSGKMDTSAFEVAMEDYYTSEEAVSAIDAAVSGKMDSSAFDAAIEGYYTSGEVDARILTETSGKADTSALSGFLPKSENITVLSIASGGGIGLVVADAAGVYQSTYSTYGITHNYPDFQPHSLAFPASGGTLALTSDISAATSGLAELSDVRLTSSYGGNGEQFSDWVMTPWRPGITISWQEDPDVYGVGWFVWDIEAENYASFRAKGDLQSTYLTWTAEESDYGAITATRMENQIVYRLGPDGDSNPNRNMLLASEIALSAALVRIKALEDKLAGS